MSATRNSFDATALGSRPLVRRAYQAFVAALAAFILVLVILREPLRGYLAEVQIVGPATEGFELNDAARWLREADAHAVVASPALGASPRSIIRIRLLAARPEHATRRLEELAVRWLREYLPQRLKAHRQAIVTKLRATLIAAREAEDAAHEQLEALRQQQIAHLFESPTVEQRADALPDGRQADASQAAPPTSTNPGQLQQHLLELRLELARLLATFTDEHPQVMALRSQIAGLEQSAGASAGDMPLPPIGRGTRNRDAAAGHFVSITTAAISESETASAREVAAAEMTAAIQRLSRASRQRQEAEHRLSDRMQELSSASTAADWSSPPAKIVTRVGGTPRTSTLMLGGILATLAGIAMFRASAIGVAHLAIRTTGELATLLDIPVVGDLSRPNTAVPRRFIITPSRLCWATHTAEAIVAIALAACLVSIAMEPSSVWHVLSDPLGTLSEVIERLKSCGAAP